MQVFDLVLLDDLSEETICDVLKKRLMKHVIYTVKEKIILQMSYKEK